MTGYSLFFFKRPLFGLLNNKSFLPDFKSCNVILYLIYLSILASQLTITANAEYTKQFSQCLKQICPNHSGVSFYDVLQPKKGFKNPELELAKNKLQHQIDALQREYIKYVQESKELIWLTLNRNVRIESQRLQIPYSLAGVSFLRGNSGAAHEAYRSLLLQYIALSQRELIRRHPIVYFRRIFENEDDFENINLFISRISSLVKSIGQEGALFNVFTSGIESELNQYQHMLATGLATTETLNSLIKDYGGFYIIWLANEYIHYNPELRSDFEREFVQQSGGLVSGRLMQIYESLEPPKEAGYTTQVCSDFAQKNLHLFPSAKEISNLNKVFESAVSRAKGLSSPDAQNAFGKKLERIVLQHPQERPELVESLISLLSNVVDVQKKLVHVLNSKSYYNLNRELSLLSYVGGDSVNKYAFANICERFAISKYSGKTSAVEFYDTVMFGPAMMFLDLSTMEGIALHEIGHIIAPTILNQKASHTKQCLIKYRGTEQFIGEDFADLFSAILQPNQSPMCAFVPEIDNNLYVLESIVTEDKNAAHPSKLLRLFHHAQIVNQEMCFLNSGLDVQSSLSCENAFELDLLKVH